MKGLLVSQKGQSKLKSRLEHTDIIQSISTRGFYIQGLLIILFSFLEITLAVIAVTSVDQTYE